jgi:prepilin-type N-terminal cleavage/methylation domain-containing protein
MKRSKEQSNKVQIHKDGRRKQVRGFTLLEVLVALTIAGMALGGLFAVIGGNKRLAWRAEAALVRATQVRSAINEAQLDDTRGELPPAAIVAGLRIEADIELAEPEERNLQGTVHHLRGYEVLDDAGEVLARGSYWVELDLPE